jgi:hypothetical protein
MSVERISSPIIITPQGQSFSALEINGDGFEVVNASEERDSTGQTYPAGSQSVISVRPDTGSTINASYIKTGVIDANLMRAGLIQTVPSWNTKWYGAPADHAAVQMGFTGGSIAATAVSTGSGTVSLTLPGGHGLTTGDYVRVSGLYFTTGTLLGGVGLNLPTNGPLDYASATVATNTLTYSKADITSGLTASTASIVYVGKALAISTISRVFDDPDNPAELSTVTVTTSAAHGFAVGDYIELTGTIETLDGVAYVTTVPTSTTFTFKQRFGDDVTFDGTSTGISLPTLGAPVAIKVLKSYTQNADGSIHITSGTVDSTLIVGEISATEITIGSGEGVVRVGNYPDAISPTFQGIWAGSADPSTAEFSVSTAGALVATSGSIGGFTLSSTSLTTGTGASAVGLLPGTFPFFAGSSTASSAPFRVASTGDLTVTNVTIVGTDTTVNTTNTGKLTLQPSLSQGASLILTDGTLVKNAGYSATRNTTTGNVVVTYAGTDILVGMFITTATTPANFYVINAKVTAVTPGVSFTYQMPTGTTASGTITSFTAYKSLQFLGGGLTRFQQTTGDAGAVAAGSLILGNNTGLNNIGTANLVIPADGELVFNTVLNSSTTALTPKYAGGGNLYQSATNVLRTDGSFTVDGTLTATTISATNYGLVANDIPTLTLGTDTTGNYVAAVTAGTGVTITGAVGEGVSQAVSIGQAVATTSSVTFGSITVNGNTVLGDASTDQIRSTNLFGTTDVTNSQTLKIYTLGNTSPSRIQWRIFRETSSERFKVNILPLPDSDEILQIQPSSYYDKAQYEADPGTATLSYGLIAEQMEQNSIGSKFVSHNEDGLPETVQYDKLVVPLISAMRKLRSRIDELEARLAELETDA